MAYKQYLGARYVPLIDGDWDENKVYEPLTVVNYLNNSYTSKKTVPAGTLPTNSTYWALTGNYNAGIGTLTQRVDTIDGEIVDINNAITNIEDVELPAVAAELNKAERNLASRNFIFIADSYGGLGWTSGVISRLSLTAHAINIGGAGFYAAGGGSNFQDGLEDYAATLTDDEKAAVTDIIVLGGVNDYNETVANIGAAIDAFNAYAKTTFPNAKIGCGCLSWMKRGNDIDGYVNRVIPTYQSKFSSTARCYYIPKMYVPMHNYANINSDGIHPNASGTAAIINYVSSWLLNGEADYVVNSSPTFTLVTGATGTLAINTKMNKDGVDVLFSGGTLTLPDAKTYNSYSALTKIGELSGGCVSGHVSTGLSVTGMADFIMEVPCTFVTSTSHTCNGVALLNFYDGRVDISGVCVDYATGANTYGTCTTVVLGSAHAHVGLLSC